MKRRESIAPDLTPLIDVAFLLLIFFMVSTVFKKDELALNLSLPKSSAERITIDNKQITIEVSNDYLAINGKIYSLDDFEKIIAQNANTHKNKALIVRIDKEVKYERVTKILDILQKNELNNLALITD